MAEKKLINKSGFDMSVVLFVRSGSDPHHSAGIVTVFLPDGDHKTVPYGSSSDPFLNGISMRANAKDGGSLVVKREMVTVRGSAWDNTLNTNNTLTIDIINSVNVKGSNT